MAMSDSQLVRTLIGAGCVVAFSFHAFSFTAPTPQTKAGAQLSKVQMPTARDLEFFERRLSKQSNESRFSKRCGRGEYLGNTTVYVAMNFPSRNASVSRDTPAIGNVHVESTGVPKAVVLDSQHPTLWSVTGEPSVIVLLGEAVVSNYPENATVYAPRMNETCRGAWERYPTTWSPPREQAHVNSLVGDVKNKYDNRARMVSFKLFERDFSGWEVRRDGSTFKF